MASGCANAVYAPRRCPPGYGLGVDSEQCRYFAWCEQTLANLHVPSTPHVIGSIWMDFVHNLTISDRLCGMVKSRPQLQHR